MQHEHWMWASQWKLTTWGKHWTRVTQVQSSMHHVVILDCTHYAWVVIAKECTRLPLCNLRSYYMYIYGSTFSPQARIIHIHEFSCVCDIIYEWNKPPSWLHLDMHNFGTVKPIQKKIKVSLWSAINVLPVGVIISFSTKIFTERVTFLQSEFMH